MFVFKNYTHTGSVASQRGARAIKLREGGVPATYRRATRTRDDMSAAARECARRVRQAVYFFHLGGAINLLAWAPVLCRVARGVARYPDQMPTAVWIATLGIFGMFFLFVMAEASGFVGRIRAIARTRVGAAALPWACSRPGTDAGAPPRESCCTGCQAPSVPLSVYLIASVSQRSWGILALTGFTSLLLLAGSVLLTIPTIRAVFTDVTITERSRAEPWFIMAFLMFLACGFILVALWTRGETGGTWILRSYKARLATFCVTLLLCTGFFALWTWVSREMNNDTETAWKLIATAAFVCLGGLAAWNAKLTVASLAPSPAHGEDAAVQEDSDAVYELCIWHERAAVVHLGLAAFALLVGLSAGVDYVADYLLGTTDLPLVVSDWQGRIKETVDGKTVATTLALCASGSPLPVFRIWCCCAWSLCSCLQHVFSYRTLSSSPELVRPPLDANGQARILKYATVCLVGAVIVTGTVYPPTRTIAVILALSGLPAWYVLVSGVWGILPDLSWGEVNRPKNTGNLEDTDEQRSVSIRLVPPSPPGDAATDPPNEWLVRLQRVRTYRWIEYSVSATTMFVIVLAIGDVRTAHELVLAAGLFCVSMLLINPATMALDDAERACGVEVKVPDVVRREMPFLFLSFFAKTLLCVSLTVPLVFAAKTPMSVALSTCTVAAIA